MDKYKVYADRETGLWLTEPELIGTVDAEEWHQLADTNAVHYDTFELNDVTCAVAVYWQD